MISPQTRSFESLENHLDQIDEAVSKGGTPLFEVPPVPPPASGSQRDGRGASLGTPGGLNPDGTASCLNFNTLSSSSTSQERCGAPADFIAGMAPHVMESYTPDEVAACEKVYRYCVAHKTNYSLEGA